MSLQLLLVEDDEEDYLLTRKLLRDHEGASFVVTWVRTYEEAVVELEKPYDVCLVDYRLGARTGLELITAGVARGFKAPMILLTGRGDHEVDVMAMRLGAADYLVKDQITSQLLERVIRHSIERVSGRATQKHGENALRESEHQYRDIVEATSDGILKLALDGKIAFANRRFAEMLGYTPREMLGTDVFAYMTEASKFEATGSFAQCAHGVKVAIDSTFLHRNGTEIWCNIAGTQLLDAEGVHVGNLGMVRDETERRKLHAQLMVSDRMASVGTLAAGVAHEINNPLAAVIANLEFVAEAVAKLADGTQAVENADTWFRSELMEPLNDARDATQRVRFIVRDLKLFSRSPIEDPKAPVDVKAIMESSLRMAWNEIRHRARLVKNYGATVGVFANEARLGQVFLNLLVNAAQAIPEGRVEHNEIHVATRMEGERVVIEVSDSGPGIPPHVLPRIF
ncbi:MAG: PAS domain S-box protein, partial [Deltaproteobacteria bacterium]|nr:PAS domain S-box protein [Deltaproteobacteria bacterium]